MNRINKKIVKTAVEEEKALVVEEEVLFGLIDVFVGLYVDNELSSLYNNTPLLYPYKNEDKPYTNICSGAPADKEDKNG